MARRTKKWTLAWSSAAVFPALALIAYAADRTELAPVCLQQPVGDREIVIRRVVDGDTVVDQCGRKIRIVGIDAPERGDPGGREATAFVRDWLRPVTTPVTMALCPEQARDRYGRLLARIQRGDRDLSSDMLATGNAWIMAIPPCGEAYLANDHMRLHDAVAAGKGVWQQHSLAPRSARDVITAGGYVLVKDTVTGVSENKRHTDLILGRKPDHLVVRINRSSLPKLHEAGLEPEKLTGQVLVVEGKLYSRTKGTPRLFLDYPELLHTP